LRAASAECDAHRCSARAAVRVWLPQWERGQGIRPAHACRLALEAAADIHLRSRWAGMPMAFRVPPRCCLHPGPPVTGAWHICGCPTAQLATWRPAHACAAAPGLAPRAACRRWYYAARRAAGAGDAAATSFDMTTWNNTSRVGHQWCMVVYMVVYCLDWRLLAFVNNELNQHNHNTASIVPASPSIDSRLFY
jgi:hypothetical protein